MVTTHCHTSTISLNEPHSAISMAGILNSIPPDHGLPPHILENPSKESFEVLLDTFRFQLKWRARNFPIIHHVASFFKYIYTTPRTVRREALCCWSECMDSSLTREKMQVARLDEMLETSSAAHGQVQNSTIQDVQRRQESLDECKTELEILKSRLD